MLRSAACTPISSKPVSRSHAVGVLSTHAATVLDFAEPELSYLPQVRDPSEVRCVAMVYLEPRTRAAEAVARSRDRSRDASCVCDPDSSQPSQESAQPAVVAQCVGHCHSRDCTAVHAVGEVAAVYTAARIIVGGNCVSCSDLSVRRAGREVLVLSGARSPWQSPQALGGCSEPWREWLFLALLGGLAAHAGGAKVMAGAIRVIFCSVSASEWTDTYSPAAIRHGPSHQGGNSCDQYVAVTRMRGSDTENQTRG